MWWTWFLAGLAVGSTVELAVCTWCEERRRRRDELGTGGLGSKRARWWCEGYRSRVREDYYDQLHEPQLTEMVNAAFKRYACPE